MSTMILTLPDSLMAFVESQVARRGLASANDYLEALIREDQEKAENDEIERKLLEALLGAPAAPVTAETWEAIKQDGLGRAHESAAPTGLGIPIAEWRADIVSEWREELTGWDLLDMKPVGDGPRHSLILRGDGTAD